MTDNLIDVPATSFDGTHLRQVMGHFATGVTVITAMDDSEPVGFTAQSFQSLSLDPPLVLFSPQKASSTWPRIRKAGAFGVNILCHDQVATCRTFATSGAERFADLDWVPGPRTGSPLLLDALAWVECKVVAEYDGGDHVIVVGQVLDLGVERDAAPLLYYRGAFGRFQV